MIMRGFQLFNLCLVALATGNRWVVRGETHFQENSGTSMTETAAMTGTTADSSFEDADEKEEERRLTMARLRSHIRNLPTAREKVAPSVADKYGYRRVNLEADVSVLAVLGIDDVQETMTTGMYLYLIWQDKSLKWNASEYGGIDWANLSADDIWMPTLNVANSGNVKDIVESTGKVVVHSGGHIRARLPFYVETRCPLDLTHYPYDDQVCFVLIYSFHESIAWVRVHHDVAGSKALAESLGISSEWEMMNTSVQLIRMHDDDEVTLKIMLHLRRKTTFYTVCLVLPMVMTSYMNTLVFLLPPESGEKISFLVSIFVSTSVFLSYFTSVMPRGLDSVPSTMKLFLGVIIESLLVLLATIVVLRRFHQQQQPTEQAEPLKSDQSGTTLASSGHVRRGCFKNRILNVQAEFLDRAFFVVAFVGNTAFLAALLHQAIASTTSKVVGKTSA